MFSPFETFGEFSLPYRPEEALDCEAAIISYSYTGLALLIRAFFPPHAALAPGWAELIDTDSRTPYFWNASTGETTWERPVAPSTSEPKNLEAEEGKEEEENKIDMGKVRARMIRSQYCRSLK